MGDTFNIVSVGELLNENEGETLWILDKLLIEAGTTLLLAKPKSGKTTFATQVAYAVAAGVPFLERPTLQSDVLYLAAEEKRSEVRRRFAQLGVTPDSDLPLHLHIGAFPTDILTSFAQLEQLIRGTGAGYCVIDTLLDFLVGVSPNSSKMKRYMNMFRDLARGTGCHITFVHHTNKGKIRSVQDAASGSNQIFAGVDAQFVLVRNDDSNTVSLASLNRYGDSIPWSELVFDPTSHTVSLGQNTAIETEQRDVIKQRIIEYMTNAKGEDLKETVIRASVKGDSSLIGEVLREIIDQGVVERYGYGVRGSPFYYRLTPTNAQSLSITN
jgi:hypothetical protein